MLSSAFAYKVWIVALLCWLAPPGRSRAWDKSDESTADAYARYWSIADDYRAVVFDAPLEDLPFHSRARTTAYLLAIGMFESGFGRNVDLGLGKRARGDGGRSVCHLQVNVGRGTTPEGWTAADLLADRQKCIRRGLAIVKLSLGACPHNAPEDRLSVYAAGSCTHGREESRARVRLAERIASRTAPRPATPRPAPEETKPLATLP